MSAEQGKPRVAVIGAGLAGLACARALQSDGLRVRVFEKSRGPSGRMSTRRGDDWQCDHGAQYFTARDPDFRAEVERWCAEGVAARWAGRIRAIDAAGVRTPDPSLERFVGVPRMTAPAVRLAASLDLVTQCEIRELRRDPDGWRLRADADGWLADAFEAVVIAVPGPQAGVLLDGHAPALADLARGAPMRGAWAVMLRHDAPLPLPFDGAFVNHGPLRWVARDSSKPGRTGPETWLLHATPEWSAPRLEAPADAVAAELVDAFVAIGGARPVAWTAHRWRYADTAPPLGQGCAWDRQAAIGLCGDWLDAGKVEGAWCSGRALAQTVVAALSGAAPG
jgi:predicted NAD/FAD-dependent oxidoreductase